MRPVNRIAEWTTTRRIATIVVLLALTIVIGYGALGLEQETDLGQFETDSIEAEKMEYINENFGTVDDESTTSVQLIIQGDNVLDRESLIATIELQQAFRDDPLVNDTLASDPFTDVASIIATTIIQQEQGDELEAERAQLEDEFDAVNQTAAALGGSLQEIAAIQAAQSEYHLLFEAGEIDEATYQEETDQLEQHIESEIASASGDLTESEAAAFATLAEEVRELQHEIVLVEAAYEAGEITEASRDAQVSGLTTELERTFDRVGTDVLGERYAELEARGEELAAAAEQLPALQPSLDEQRQALEEVDQDRLEGVIEQLFSANQARGLLALMPTDYDPGSTTADARMLSVSQVIDDEFVAEGDAPQTIVDSQLRMAEIVDDRFGDNGFVFGQGIITDELNRSLEDSLILVIPFALLLVVGTLLIAYRDILDIILGVVGIAIVLVWTFGFMGWANINFNQIFIAVPVLLIGLSIDYAIHVFMRQREQRDVDPRRSSGTAMKVALGGLLVALTWVTATAVFGFLSNLVSPVGPIREFGIVSAFGIASALVIFGMLVPATKVTLDEFLEARGINRRKRAFGTSGGPLTRGLSVGKTFAKRAPIVVIVVALILTAGGAYGASEIDTSFEVEDFIASEPAEWTQSLPEIFRPGEYTAKANLETLDDRFQRDDLQAEILIEGEITSDDTLERLHRAIGDAGEKPAVVVLADGNPDVRSPLSDMQALANEDDNFAAVFQAADSTGDGIPDHDIEAVYDAFFEAAPERAADVIYRTDGGSYEAFRMIVSIESAATSSEVTSQMRDVATGLDGDGLEATATGQVVVFSIIEDELFDTVFESLIISLIAVILFLMIVYRITDGSAMLGLVTLAPIVLAVAWILGTMYLLGMPFNVVTGTITSLTIGLGVAYNIHMSERFRLELNRGRDVWDALYVSVTGTGGALLGSAATTAGGFGVLIVAIIPILQQFGIITALTIIYSFLGSVLVLPSLLVLWLKYLGPAVRFETTATRRLPRTYIEPDETVEGTLDLAVPTGRVVVQERFSGGVIELVSTSPTPADAVAVGNRLFVAWDLDEPTDTEVVYRLSPTDANGATPITVEGWIETPEGTTPIEGPTQIDIVQDVASVVLHRERPTLGDLRLAGELADDGRLSPTQVEIVYDRWMATYDGREEPMPALEAAKWEWVDESKIEADD